MDFPQIMVSMDRHDAYWKVQRLDGGLRSTCKLFTWGGETSFDCSGTPSNSTISVYIGVPSYDACFSIRRCART